ncbi:MAG: RNA methyltransferase [Anaerolineae bacterium]|nr:RNA methyltransferase [Anaerolineae bacterium]
MQRSTQGVVPTITLELLLDNIRSAFNVGSIFRSADGAGVRHIHICGITPTPDHPRVVKTALGAEMVIPWTQHWNSLEAAQKLKQKGYTLWGLECTSTSTALPQALRNYLPSTPLLLIAGNELGGVDADLIAQCDQVVHIPMLGIKESLNVAVAVSIAIYMIQFYPTKS